MAFRVKKFALALFCVFWGSHSFGAGEKLADSAVNTALMLGFKMEPPQLSQNTDLEFQVDQGSEQNFFYRRGRIAAHVALTSGTAADVVVAFAAGNSGTGLWFSADDQPIQLTMIDKPKALSQGHQNGVRFTLHSNQGHLLVDQSALGSIRTLRDFAEKGIKPAAFAETITMISPEQVRLTRSSLDGKSGYTLEIRIPGGTIRRSAHGHLQLLGPMAASGDMNLEIHSLSGDPLLTPLPLDNLISLEQRAKLDPRKVQMLSFLAYREKLMAGSWRFLTYFGRDSIFMGLLLMDILHPDALEAILSSVLQRMNSAGEVAHEENIGDFASWKHRLAGQSYTSDPIYEHQMIDDSFLFPPLIGFYLKKVPRARSMAFLNRFDDTGRSHREALSSNLQLVLNAAESFAGRPVFSNLVSLKPNQLAGQWRDSDLGLGGGVYPFDVNVVLVPVALDVAAQIYSDPTLGLMNKAQQNRAEQYMSVWKTQARSLFQVEIPVAEANRRAARYMRRLNLKAPEPVQSPVRFSALALRKDGSPVKVMHSDEGISLLLTRPEDGVLREICANVTNPFPYGLRTNVGMFIANPAFAEPELQAVFTSSHYHGTVVWPWQSALMAKGLATQMSLASHAVSASTRDALNAATRSQWQGIEALRDHLDSELWSWTAANGKISYVPYGQDKDHATKSNALQGWSLVYMGIQDPLQTQSRAVLSSRSDRVPKPAAPVHMDPTGQSTNPLRTRAMD